MKLCGFEVGADQPLFLIAGPCVIESEQLALDTAGRLKEITSRLGIPFIYKSSFDKANRSSGGSFRGPGLEGGLKVLAEVKRQIGVPVLTDAFQAGGLVWRGLIPWDKTEASRAPHKGYFRHQAEYVVWGSNGPLAIAEHGGPWPGVVRERVGHRTKFHMTGKPRSTPRPASIRTRCARRCRPPSMRWTHRCPPGSRTAR